MVIFNISCNLILDKRPYPLIPSPKPYHIQALQGFTLPVVKANNQNNSIFISHNIGVLEHGIIPQNPKQIFIEIFTKLCRLVSYGTTNKLPQWFCY